MAEQRHRTVLEVIAEGRAVSEVAAQSAVSRQTLHDWLAATPAGPALAGRPPPPSADGGVRGPASSSPGARTPSPGRPDPPDAGSTVP
ncbi:MAG: hypothetical protein ACXVXZ_12065 [Mycobacteriaceae bacterium]